MITNKLKPTSESKDFKIYLDKSTYLLLDMENQQWKVVGDVKPDMDQQIKNANVIITNYRYSPGDGFPGYKITKDTAEAIKGKPVVPPTPKVNKDVVY